MFVFLYKKNYETIQICLYLTLNKYTFFSLGKIASVQKYSMGAS